MATNWRLEIKGLTKNFGGLRAVNELSFGIGNQEIVGLIGPNGSGKTTSINVISSYYKPTAGQIIFNGQPITGAPPWRIAKMGIARTFQHTLLFPRHSVLENVVLACHVHEKTGIADSIFRRWVVTEEKSNSEKKSKELLAFVGLSELLRVPSGGLSPGAQRALSIAMALATEPKVLLLDEPAAGLSAEESARLVDLIGDLKKRGVSVMVVDHRMPLIMNICDRIVVIDHGTKIAEGKPKEIANNEQVIEAYLGHAKASWRDS